MRIVIILALLVATQIPSFSQDALTTTWVTLQARRLPLPQAFKTIQQKTGLLFVYQPGLVDIYRDVYMPEGRFIVAAALDSVLKDTELGYTESNRNIIVFKVPHLVSIRGFVQDGQYVNNLPGATVRVRHTDRSTTTDATGHFEIEALTEDILDITFAGMLPGEFKVGLLDKTKDLVFSLKPILLDEVTVNGGYYRVRNVEQTGNISSVSRSQINNQPVSNPLQALQAQMPGVVVQSLSGVPGSGMTVQIRGPYSLREKNSPLYLIDGVPYPDASLSSVLTAGMIIPNSSSMNGISPNMIESIDVLKDADATAIYGSRGANGVVLITTRRSPPLGIGVEVNVNTGVSDVANFVDLLKRAQWLQIRNEAFKNDRAVPNESNAPDLVVWDTTRNTNWQKKLIGGTASFADASFNVHGGTNDVRVLGVYNINKQGSVFPGDFGYTRSSALFNIQITPQNNKLKFASSFNYSMEDNKLPPIDFTKEATGLSPVAPDVYTPEDDLNWANGTWINPYSYLRNSLQAKAKYFLASSQFSYHILPGLIFKSNAGFTNIDRQEINLRKISSQNPISGPKPLTGTQTKSNVASSTWIVEPQFRYSNESKLGEIAFLVGATFQSTSQEGSTLVGTGYTSDATLESMPSAPVIESYEPSNSEYKYNSLFTRLSYNFKNRYLLNLTGRRDASSRFAPGLVANFGAVGAGWIFTNERFGRNWRFIDHGKIRVSYGTSGNDQIGDYGYLDSYATTDLTYGGDKGIYAVRVSNSSYSWELSKKGEVGLQLGFLKNRLQLELSYYRNISTNQLLGRSLSATTGFESVQYNLPVEVRSSGLEVVLNTIPVVNDKVRWTSNLNLTFPTSELKRYDNLGESSDSRRYIVGESVGILKRFKYLSINPENGNFLYDDINSDNMYDASDLQKTKTYGVHWYGGVENTILYKAFQLSINIQYVNQTRESLMKQFAALGSLDTNQPIEVMGRWKNSGDISNHHRATQSTSGIREYLKGQQAGENAYADADYLRIKNISLLYSLPGKICNKMSLNGLSIYLRSQNVLTVTDYRGFDPENADVRVLPPLRTVVLGIQLNL